jgi:hypothetical protein
MSDLIDALTDGLIRREEEVGSTIVFAGDTYPCSSGSLNGDKLLSQGGFRMTSALTVILRLDLIPDGKVKPAENHSVIYTSRPDGTPVTMRVSSTELVYDSILILKLENQYQGAA